MFAVHQIKRDRVTHEKKRDNLIEDFLCGIVQGVTHSFDDHHHEKHHLSEWRKRDG